MQHTQLCIGTSQKSVFVGQEHCATILSSFIEFNFPRKEKNQIIPLLVGSNWKQGTKTQHEKNQESTIVTSTTQKHHLLIMQNLSSPFRGLTCSFSWSFLSFHATALGLPPSLFVLSSNQGPVLATGFPTPLQEAQQLLSRLFLQLRRFSVDSCLYNLLAHWQSY